MGETLDIGTATAIDGVELVPLAIIPTVGGPVLHMLRRGSPLISDATFGEIYFSEVLPGCVKAWKCHRRQCQHFAVPVGLLRLVLYDGRAESSSEGALLSVTLGRPDHYALLRIPPGVWYGFQALGEVPALICNYADMPHDPTESDRLPADASQIPFHWV